jgi:hypothetical protein
MTDKIQLGAWNVPPDEARAYCEKWILDPLVNPITGIPIQEHGFVYDMFDEACARLGIYVAGKYTLSKSDADGGGDDESSTPFLPPPPAKFFESAPRLLAREDELRREREEIVRREKETEMRIRSTLGDEEWPYVPPSLQDTVVDKLTWFDRRIIKAVEARNAIRAIPVAQWQLCMSGEHSASFKTFLTR